MITDFTYIRAESVNQVLALLEVLPADITILAGGTDVIPGMNLNSRRFQGIRQLLDIHHLDELKKIYIAEDHIHIGAAADFSRIAADPLVSMHTPLLTAAAERIGSVQIRNRATIGGNIVNNAPCADSVAPLLVYNAMVRLRSSRNQRDVALDDFLTGSYQTARQENELVTEVFMPIPDKGYRGEFRKLGRRRGVAVSRISLAVLAKTDAGRIKDLRISSGAVTPVGIRFHDIEKSASDKDITTDLLKGLSTSAGQAVLDVTGLRWSGFYKLPVLQQMLFQVLNNVLELSE
jgi:CO/xanthine dehydrogenase FAD-binding subunit